MIIGIPKEIKNNEYRVALPPSGVRELIKHGHTVLVEYNAGEGSGFPDAEYVQAGAQLQQTDAVWQRANLVVKVKEPQPTEYAYLRPDLVLFTYLHLESAEGHLPLLQPMSEVAGRMATQVVAHYLQKPEGGRGVLMGGIPGVRPAKVVVLGGGTVGTNAAQVALGMGAEVTLLDINTERLRYLDEVLHGRFVTLYSNEQNIADCLRDADAVIGAVLLPGARAPHLVSRDMLSLMPRNSVIVDVAVDQGGCVETTHATTHSDPTYVVDGVLHYGVANMPGAVPRTSSFGLANATLRYILRVADLGVDEAMARDPGLAKGLNMRDGRITYPAVAEAFGLALADTSA